MASMADALGDALGEVMGMAGAAEEGDAPQVQHNRFAVYASVMRGLTKWECETEKGWIMYAADLADGFEACQVQKAHEMHPFFQHNTADTITFTPCPLPRPTPPFTHRCPTCVLSFRTTIPTALLNSHPPNWVCRAPPRMRNRTSSAWRELPTPLTKAREASHSEGCPTSARARTTRT